jgi:diguanylate cyclase (GGDEF)-like protein
MADDKPSRPSSGNAVEVADESSDLVTVPRALLAAACRSEPDALHALCELSGGLVPPNAEGVRAWANRIIRRLNGQPSVGLVQANEILAVAARDSKMRADTAVQNLLDVTRWSERDPLTNTPNRALMLDRIQCAIALARRQKTQVAVLFVDLDSFKLINDSLGHAAGDEALRLAARRFKSAVRESDTVSRHSGDEFLVLLAVTSRGSDAAHIARHLIAALAQPAVVGKQALCLSASIGIALYPDDGNDAASLISAADAAMFTSKRRGPGGFEFHTPPGTAVADAAAAPVSPGQEKRRLRPEPAANLQELRDVIQELVGAATRAKQVRAKTEASYLRQIRFLAARRERSVL